MKILLLVSLILITTITLNAQFSFHDYKKTCYEDNPTYYTTRQINVYEDMSNQSAISMDIESGEAVKVTQSFFGDTGWWEICYEGKTGWVKKAYLTRKHTTQKALNYTAVTNSTNNNEDADTDIGFEPFLGKTNASVNFRTSPSTSSGIIRQLPIGTQLYVFSNKDANGFYKIIDIKTGKIGWVSKNMVKWTGSASINYSGAFQSTGKTNSFNSLVTVKNASSYNITLIVGSKTYFLSPNSTEYKNISPGSSYYVATAPGVIPSSGYQTFNSNEKYEWEFWVETRR